MALEFFAMAMAVNFFGDDDGARFSNGYHTFFLAMACAQRIRGELPINEA